jgi:hypothetical protein
MLAGFLTFVFVDEKPRSEESTSLKRTKSNADSLSSGAIQSDKEESSGSTNSLPSSGSSSSAVPFSPLPNPKLAQIDVSRKFFGEITF